MLLLLQRNIAPFWHHTMPGEGGIHPISSFGGDPRTADGARKRIAEIMTGFPKPAAAKR